MKDMLRSSYSPLRVFEVFHTFSKWIPVYRQTTEGKRFRVTCSIGYFEPTKGGAEDLKTTVKVVKSNCLTVN